MEDYYEKSEFEDGEFEDQFRSPNDGAYEKKETRTGPPLDYVAEKIQRSLEMIHGLLAILNKAGMDGVQKESLFTQVQGAFRYQLTSYLALKNMLAVVNNKGFFQRAEQQGREDFSDWLDGIDQQGSVQG